MRSNVERGLIFWNGKSGLVVYIRDDEDVFDVEFLFKNKRSYGFVIYKNDVLRKRRVVYLYVDDDEV